MRAGKPVARLVPAEELRHRRQLGWALGEFVVPAGFDDPLPAEIEAKGWRDFFKMMRTISVQDEFMADRPMNHPPRERNPFVQEQ